jgi:hypothetical protein
MTTLEDVCRAADKTWNAMAIAGAIMRIMQAQPKLSMLDFEDTFRKIGSERTFLVAWPRRLVPRGVMTMNLDRTPAKYALWVCVNGEQDMLNQIAEFGLSVEENRKALRKTGFCVEAPT